MLRQDWVVRNDQYRIVHPDGRVDYADGELPKIGSDFGGYRVDFISVHQEESTVYLGPGTATIGGPGSVNLSWTGLTAGKKYLGRVLYKEGTTTHGTTIVRVDS